MPTSQARLATVVPFLGKMPFPQSPQVICFQMEHRYKCIADLDIVHNLRVRKESANIGPRLEGHRASQVP